MDSTFRSIQVIDVGSFQLKINHAQPLERVNCSPVFTFGDHDWSLVYVSPVSDNPNIFVLPMLVTETEGVTVKATCDLRLVNKDGNPSLEAFRKASHTFSHSGKAYPFALRIPKIVLEEKYLVDGCFVVNCTIIIPAESIREPCESTFELHKHIGNLFESNDMVDIIFEVEGEIFHAHKTILAARSPVFKAELFGLMVEAKSDRIKIEDMKVVVFKGLLSYIYTDSFEQDDLSIVQHLLVAATRYALDGLRLLCEERLSVSVSLDTAMSYLVLAEQHNCKGLKDACLDFAVKLGNFLPLTLTDGYLQVMQNNPSIFAALHERMSCSVAFKAATKTDEEESNEEMEDE